MGIERRKSGEERHPFFGNGTVGGWNGSVAEWNGTVDGLNGTVARWNGDE